MSLLSVSTSHRRLWRPLAALPKEAGVLALVDRLADILWRLDLLPRASPARSRGLRSLHFPAPSLMEAGLGKRERVSSVSSPLDWRDRAWVGAILGVMIAAKLWPAVLAVWLLAQGAGPSSSRSPRSSCAPSRLGEPCGVPVCGYERSSVRLQPHVAGSGSHGCGWRAFSLERASWLPRAADRRGIAVLTMVLGSPIANPNTYAQLLAILAPAGTRDRARRDNEEKAASASYVSDVNGFLTADARSGSRRG